MATNNSILNSVVRLTADDPAPNIVFNWTVYDTSYTHVLRIKNGDTIILALTGLSESTTGTTYHDYQLTNNQRNILLQNMSNVKSFIATYELVTLGDGGLQVGETSSVDAVIETLEENSKPVFEDFTFNDVEPKTVDVTDNDQLLIQNQSNLLILCDAATARNSATIVKYTAVLGSVTKEALGTTIAFGTPLGNGSLDLTVTVEDSRGYTTSVTKSVTVLPYNSISFDYWQSKRINSVEENVHTYFDGRISPVKIGNVAKNSVQEKTYRFKKTSDQSWGTWFNFAGVTSHETTFSYDDVLLTLSAEFSWNVEVKITDKLTFDVISFIVNKGIPLVAFRSGRVGINTLHPQAPFDVVGNIHMNGFNILGFIASLTEEDLDDLIETGIYYQPSSEAAFGTKHYPIPAAGFLRIIGHNENANQLYYDYNGAGIYTRTYKDGNWTEWRQLYLKPLYTTLQDSSGGDILDNRSRKIYGTYILTE